MKGFVNCVLVVALVALFAACDDSSSTPSVPESSSAVDSSSSEIASSSSVELVESSSVEVVPESSAEIESSESSADTVWNRAVLTWYTSWPEPGSEECEDYNGCTWAGWFAGLSINSRCRPLWLRLHVRGLLLR